MDNQIFISHMVLMVFISIIPLSEQQKVCKSKEYFTYIDLSKKNNINEIECKSCDPSCLSCLSGQQDCKVCATNYFGAQTENSCTLNCQEGELKYLNRQCIKCIDNCKLCSSPGLCDICNDGYILSKYLSPPQCVPDCKPDQYFQQGDCVKACSAFYSIGVDSKTCVRAQNCRKLEVDSIDQCLITDSTELKFGLTSVYGRDLYFFKKLNGLLYFANNNLEIVKSIQLDLTDAVLGFRFDTNDMGKMIFFDNQRIYMLNLVNLETLSFCTVTPGVTLDINTSFAVFSLNVISAFTSEFNWVFIDMTLGTIKYSFQTDIPNFSFYLIGIRDILLSSYQNLLILTNEFKLYEYNIIDNILTPVCQQFEFYMVMNDYEELQNGFYAVLIVRDQNARPSSSVFGFFSQLSDCENPIVFKQILAVYTKFAPPKIRKTPIQPGTYITFDTSTILLVYHFGNNINGIMVFTDTLQQGQVLPSGFIFNALAFTYSTKNFFGFKKLIPTNNTNLEFKTETKPFLMGIFLNDVIIIENLNNNEEEAFVIDFQMDILKINYVTGRVTAIWSCNRNTFPMGIEYWNELSVASQNIDSRRDLFLKFSPTKFLMIDLENSDPYYWNFIPNPYFNIFSYDFRNDIATKDQKLIYQDVTVNHFIIDLGTFKRFPVTLVPQPQTKAPATIIFGNQMIIASNQMIYELNITQPYNVTKTIPITPASQIIDGFYQQKLRLVLLFFATFVKIYDEKLVQVFSLAYSNSQFTFGIECQFIYLDNFNPPQSITVLINEIKYFKNDQVTHPTSAFKLNYKNQVLSFEPYVFFEQNPGQYSLDAQNQRIFVFNETAQVYRFSFLEPANSLNILMVQTSQVKGTNPDFQIGLLSHQGVVVTTMTNKAVWLNADTLEILNTRTFTQGNIQNLLVFNDIIILLFTDQQYFPKIIYEPFQNPSQYISKINTYRQLTMASNTIAWKYNLDSYQKEYSVHILTPALEENHFLFEKDLLFESPGTVLKRYIRQKIQIQDDKYLIGNNYELQIIEKRTETSLVVSSKLEMNFLDISGQKIVKKYPSINSLEFQQPFYLIQSKSIDDQYKQIVFLFSESTTKNQLINCSLKRVEEASKNECSVIYQSSIKIGKDLFIQNTDYLVISFGDGNLLSESIRYYDLHTNSMIWEFQLLNNLKFITFSVDSDRRFVYVLSENFCLYLISLNDGQPVDELGLEESKICYVQMAQIVPVSITISQIYINMEKRILLIFHHMFVLSRHFYITFKINQNSKKEQITVIEYFSSTNSIYANRYKQNFMAFNSIYLPTINFYFSLMPIAVTNYLNDAIYKNSNTKTNAYHCLLSDIKFISFDKTISFDLFNSTHKYNYEYVSNTIINTYLINEEHSLVILGLVDGIELLTYDAAKFTQMSKISNLMTVNKIAFDAINLRIVFDYTYTGAEHNLFVWSPFIEGIPFMQYHLPKLENKKFSSFVSNENQLVFYYNQRNIVQKYVEGSSEITNLPLNIYNNSDSFIRQLDQLDGFVLILSQSDLRIIQESTGKEISAGFGGKDFLIDKNNQIVFYFDWRFRIFTYDLQSDASSAQNSLKTIVTESYLTKFTIREICQEFKHIIVVFDFRNIDIFSYSGGTSLYQEISLIQTSLAISRVIFDPFKNFLLIVSPESIIKYSYPESGILYNQVTVEVFQRLIIGISVQFSRLSGFLVIYAPITDARVYYVKAQSNLIYLQSLYRPSPQYQTKINLERNIIVLYSQIFIMIYNIGDLQLRDAIVMKDNFMSFQADMGITDAVVLSNDLAVVLFYNVVQIYGKDPDVELGEIGFWSLRQTLSIQNGQFIYARKDVDLHSFQIWILTRMGFLVYETQNQPQSIENCKVTLRPSSFVNLYLQLEKLEQSFSQYNVGLNFQNLQLDLIFENDSKLIFPQKLKNDYIQDFSIFIIASGGDQNLINVEIDQFFDLSYKIFSNFYIRNMRIQVKIDKLELNKGLNLKVVHLSNIEWKFEYSNTTLLFQNLELVHFENMILQGPFPITKTSVFDMENIKTVIMRNITIKSLNLFKSNIFSLKRIGQLLIEGLTFSDSVLYPYLEQDMRIISIIIANKIKINGLNFNNISQGVILNGRRTVEAIEYRHKTYLLSIKVAEQTNLTQIVINNTYSCNIEVLKEFKEVINTANRFQQISLYEDSRLNILNFQAYKNKIEVPLIYTDFDSIFLENFNITDLNISMTSDGCAINAVNSQNFQVQYSEFNKINAINGGALNLKNFQSLSILNCLFTNNSAIGAGGSIYLENSLLERENFIDIQFSSFQLNVATQGGAMFLKNIISNEDDHLKMLNCSFKNNTALQFGGVIYAINTNIDIDYSEASNNMAQIGGFLYYDQSIPITVIKNSSENVLSDNQASIFGQNFASYFRDFEIEILHSNQNINFTKITDFYVFPKFKSGDTIIIQYQLIDQEGSYLSLNPELFNNYSTSIMGFIENINIKFRNLLQIQIIGDNLAPIYKYDKTLKTFNFELQVIGPPNSDGEFLIVTDNIKHGSKSDPYHFYNIDNSFLVRFQFRDCIAGELYQKIEQTNFFICQSCVDNRYSLQKPLKNSYEECLSCPIGAQLCSNDKIFLLNGFWRKNQSDLVIKCRSLDLCMQEDVRSRQICSEGHIGPLCETCDIKGTTWDFRYAQVGYFTCVQCKFVAQIALVFIGKYLFFNIYMLYSIKSNLDRAIRSVQIRYLRLCGLVNLSVSEKKSNDAWIIKSLMHFLQIVSLLRFDEVKQVIVLPEFISVPFDILGNPISTMDKSLDCWYDDKIQPIPYVYQRFIFSLMFPVIISAQIFLIFFFLKLKQWLPLKNQFVYLIGNLNKLIIIIQPSLISMIIIIMSCRKIGDSTYMLADLTEKCYDQQHLQFSISVALPFLLFWGLFLPLLALYFLAKYKDQPDQIISRLTLGLFYSDYQKKYYYWELIIFFIKLIIILGINVVQAENITKHIYLSIMVVTYLVIFIHQSPIINQHFIQIEISQYLVFATLISLKATVIASQREWLRVICCVLLFVLIYSKILFYVSKIIKIKLSDLTPQYNSLKKQLQTDYPQIFNFLQYKEHDHARVFRNWKKCFQKLSFQWEIKRQYDQILHNVMLNRQVYSQEDLDQKYDQLQKLYSMLRVQQQNFITSQRRILFYKGFFLLQFFSKQIVFFFVYFLDLEKELGELEGFNKKVNTMEDILFTEGQCDDNIPIFINESVVQQNTLVEYNFETHRSSKDEFNFASLLNPKNDQK